MSAMHCAGLRLHRVQAELSTLLEQAAKREASSADFLDEVLGLEIRSMHEKHLAIQVSMAQFSFQKSLESFSTAPSTRRRVRSRRWWRTVRRKEW